MGGVADLTQMINFLLSTAKLLVELGMLIGFSFGVFVGVLFLLGLFWDVLRKWWNDER
jgi:alpha/beta superfamily hydrolase